MGWSFFTFRRCYLCTPSHSLSTKIFTVRINDTVKILVDSDNSIIMLSA